MLAWSLALSLLAHLLLLLAPPLVIRFQGPLGVADPAVDAAREPFGMQMVVPIPSENAPEDPPATSPPEEQPPVSRATPGPPTAPRQPAANAGSGPAPAEPRPSGSGPSAAEAIRPGYSDSRLYVEPDQFPELRRTEHERYMDRLQARIDAVNDSMGVAAARDRRTSDWVYTDDSGKRWGLSPEGLHLGGFTVPRALVPLPGPTGDNQQLMEARERERMREEIREQEARRERDETREERTGAIRERADSERP